MSFETIQTNDRANENEFDRLGAELRAAAAPTPRLIQSLIARACTRLPNLGRREAERVALLIEAGAWTDAALAVIACELPQWTLRCLVYDDGEWHCALSREPHMPQELDDTADGRHEIAALAIWDAFLEARRRVVPAPRQRTVPQVRAAAGHVVCCDNFS
jgi:hypothetical protein